MLVQLLVGGAVSACNIAIHALVMTLVVGVAGRGARPAGASGGAPGRRHDRDGPVLMAAHLGEVVVWSLAYSMFNAAPAGSDLLYFAFVNYTTLGYGDVLPTRSGSSSAR